MKKDLDMRINFGFAGYCDNADQNELYNTINNLMYEFISRAEDYNSPKYGFSGKPVFCDIYTCPDFTDDFILRFNSSNNYTVNAIMPEDSVASADFNTSISLKIKKDTLGYISYVSEYMLNKSDAIFLIWNGDQFSHNGTIWTMLQQCKQKNIPCYLINTNNLDDISLSTDSYYNPYSSQTVKAYVADLYNYENSIVPEKTILFSSLWINLYKHFTKKHNIKNENITFIEDKILSSDYFDVSDELSQNHKILVEQFEYYDKKAIDASTLYRSSIYFRSILPMITTVFIAVGFYAETILGYIFGQYNLLSIAFWSIIAGLGFLCHALTNIYANQISKNKNLKNLQSEFTESRYIAEYLRAVIHSETYGFQTKNINLHKNEFSKNNNIDRKTLAKIHHILRQQIPTNYVQTDESLSEAVKNFELLINDQLKYHSASEKRYILIVERLVKFSKIFSASSIAIVISRGFLQFAFPFFTKAFPALTVKINDISTSSFIKSSANMIALVFPAWASYFSSKLNMCDFAWMKNNSEKMKNGFMKFKSNLSAIKKNQKNSYKTVADIANDIISFAENDHQDWYSQTMSKRFTRL